MLFLHITDIHLGNAGIPTKTIYDGAYDTFFKDRTYAHIDALLITGDVYDEALDHSSEDAIHAQRFVTMVLTWCKKHNVVCLLLEGTPSHDRRQSRWFEEINKLHNINATLYYFDKLTVQYIPELKMDVLAVPDEIAKPRIKADGMIKTLMKEKGITQVGIALTHGYYDFHLPKHEVENGHSSKFFKKIVKWLTFNGHIHTPTLKEDVLTGGSLARIRHGEEERKGGHLVEIKADGTYTVKFIENTHLIPFKTISVKGLKSDKLIEKVEKTVNGWETGNLRLHYRRGDEAHSLLNYLREKHPHIKLTTKVDKLELEVKEEKKELSAKISAVSLNKSNTPSLLFERMKAECDDPALIDRAFKRFTENYLTTGANA